MYGQAGLLPAIVASTGADGSATVVLANRTEIVLPAGAAKWTNKTPGKLVQRGDIVRVRAGPRREWLLDQILRGQSALVSLDAHSGALKALVGGFSFSGNKFNRATQARRQPGSSFAVRLRGRLRQGLQPGLDRARRPGRVPRPPRQDLGPAERRRRLPRPDAPA
jgi:penicillin-binding protein 1A